jgi:hypothetical protein
MRQEREGDRFNQYLDGRIMKNYKEKGKTLLTTPDLSSLLQLYPTTLKSVNLVYPSFNSFSISTLH